MTRPRSDRRRCAGAFAVALLPALVAGCSTREVVDPLSGSTAQRLVTYSLDRFTEELLAKPEIAERRGETVRLDIHFLREHPMLGYARRLIVTQMQLTHDITVAAPGEAPGFELDVFFNSIGTDNDEFGLTVPPLGFSTSTDPINILALDMYHGITEGYAVVTGPEGGDMRKTERVLARVRRDNVSTPIINFPVNQLED